MPPWPGRSRNARARSPGRWRCSTRSRPASSPRSRPCWPGRTTPDWGRVLKLAETLAGRDAEARFEAAQDAVLRFVSAELDRRRDEPPARLAALVEVADRFGRAAREAAIYNLDRRPVVLSLFGDLAEVG